MTMIKTSNDNDSNSNNSDSNNKTITIMIIIIIIARIIINNHIVQQLSHEFVLAIVLAIAIQILARRNNLCCNKKSDM